MSDEAKYIPTKYDSVFWVDTDKVKPNPFQPRREFTEDGLKSLAESIRQYGMLQPLTVTRRDVEKEMGLDSEYELIAGERRLRAAKLIGMKQVPVVIRYGETNLTKLELAIVENLQREDLNAIDRAKALKQLIDEFGITQIEAAAKIGKSREYVSNSLRLLALPEHIQSALVGKEINEAHARTLLMLANKPEEQETLFKEIILKKLPVRVVERIARSIAQERVRPWHRKTPEMTALEKSLAETLGTRVIIEAGEEGGRLMIDFFSQDDLAALASALAIRQALPAESSREDSRDSDTQAAMPVHPNTTQLEPPDDDSLYSVADFTV